MVLPMQLLTDWFLQLLIDLKTASHFIMHNAVGLPQAYTVTKMLMNVE